MDFTPRGIWPLGKVVKAHRGAEAIASSFDIQTATGIVQRPALTLCRVFPDCQVLRRVTELSSLKHTHTHTHKHTHTHAHTNTHKHTHTHTQTHTLNTRMKTFVLYFCVFTFSFQILAFVNESVKEPSSFINFLLPHTHIFHPHIYFRPPKPFHFLISIPSTYFQ